MLVSSLLVYDVLLCVCVCDLFYGVVLCVVWRYFVCVCVCCVVFRFVFVCVALCCIVMLVCVDLRSVPFRVVALL